jgi:diguanylate cyclase (GGDEF)-like protein
VAVVTETSLRGAPERAAVERALAAGVPTIVLSGSFGPEVRHRLLGLGVLECVPKDRFCAEQVVRLLLRLRAQREVRVLVVDDSATYRAEIVRLLGAFHIRAAAASSATSAIELVEADPAIRLVITDFEMPELDGLGLVAELRARRGYDRLAIIGLSANRAGTLTAQFLRTGADDFLNKPFVAEELLCRVGRSLDLIVFMDALKAAKAEAERLATHDPLTGILNRRATFDAGEAALTAAQRNKRPLAVAMLDIDHFKRVNDTHGHAIGDEAIRAVAKVCKDALRGRDVLGRFGGEELVLVLPDTSPEAARVTCERLRAEIEATAVATPSGPIHLTVSIGLSAARPEDATLAGPIDRADQALYRAKRAGRNRVVEHEVPVPSERPQRHSQSVGQG